MYSTTGTLELGGAVKAMVYANAGLGKTVLCATAPQPLIISAESGLLSLTRKNLERIFGVNTPGITYDIPVATISTIEDLKKVYLDVANPTFAANIKTVCLDSISEIAEVVLINALKATKDGRAAYGDMADQVLDLCRKFRDLPNLHVYFTAKQGFCKDANLIGPSLPGSKLAREIPYLFDEVFQLDVIADGDGVLHRYLKTQPDLKNNAKDRSGMLDTRGEPANLTHIFNKISAAA